MKPKLRDLGKERITLGIMRLAHGVGLPLPGYQTAGAAGVDLMAAIPKTKPLTLEPGERVLVPTGLSLELPSGCEAQVRPRSGLAFKHGVTVLNSPGTIDCDYRGEVQVLLINHGTEAFHILRGDRIAQLVVAPARQAILIEINALSASKRGAGGFGSTGIESPMARKKRSTAKTGAQPSTGKPSTVKPSTVKPSSAKPSVAKSSAAKSSTAKKSAASKKAAKTARKSSQSQVGRAATTKGKPGSKATGTNKKKPKEKSARTSMRREANAKAR